jgi:hypothetical protein
MTLLRRGGLAATFTLLALSAFAPADSCRAQSSAAPNAAVGNITAPGTVQTSPLCRAGEASGVRPSCEVQGRLRAVHLTATSRREQS